MLILVGPLPPPVNGQSIAFQLLIEGVKERGLRYSVVNLSGRSKATWRRAIDYVSILWEFFAKTSFGEKTVYITIAQSFRGFIRDFIMIWYSKIFRHRLICHLHGGNYGNFYASQSRWVQWIIRSTLRQADKIVILGESLRFMFDFDKRLSSKLTVVPNGLPMDLDFQEPKRLPTDRSEPIRLLYLSNLIESKGYFDVLEAVRILVKVYGLNVKCEFCGLFRTNPIDDVRVKSVDQARAMFQEYVVNHQLEENVVYLGLVDGEAKVEALRRAHFFLLPTNYSNEGQPVSIIEAMAFGNVVIATNYRAIPDLVVDGHTGFLVPYGRPDLIADAVRSVVNDPERYRSMSRAAMQRFAGHFTREAHLEKMISILTSS